MVGAWQPGFIAMGWPPGPFVTGFVITTDSLLANMHAVTVHAGAMAGLQLSGNC